MNEHALLHTLVCGHLHYKQSLSTFTHFCVCNNYYMLLQFSTIEQNKHYLYDTNTQHENFN